MQVAAISTYHRYHCRRRRHRRHPCFIIAVAVTINEYRGRCRFPINCPPDYHLDSSHFGQSAGQVGRRDDFSPHHLHRCRAVVGRPRRFIWNCGARLAPTRRLPMHQCDTPSDWRHPRDVRILCRFRFVAWAVLCHDLADMQSI